MDDAPTVPPTVPAQPVLPTAQDQQQLSLLSILYYVLAGLTALLSCLGVFYLVIGLVVAASSERIADDPNGPPPEFVELMGGLFAVIGGVLVVFQLVIAALVLSTGVCLARRRHRIYCLIVAGIICLSFPFGTALGIFTFVVLTRPGVIAMFEEGKI